MIHKADEFISDALPDAGCLDRRAAAPSGLHWAWISRRRRKRMVIGRDGQNLRKWVSSSSRYIHCPGHTPGHVVLFEQNERKVFVGDVLFAGSVGRTDLPGGSTEQLLESINNKLLPLGDDVEVYSGHGPVTTIGHERKTNPFLTGVYKLGAGRL